ncbi:MAG: SBBP repeat-containing protein, partial [Bacteroidia bacterium]
MKQLLLSLLSLLIGINCYSQQATVETYTNKVQEKHLHFMENMGQVVNTKGTPQTDVLFTAKSNGVQLWLTATGIHYQFAKTDYPAGYNPHDNKTDVAKQLELQKQAKQSTHRFTLQLVGSNPSPKVVKQKQSGYSENYYLAHCPQGITGVKAFEQITYKNVYPDIDWVIYSKGGYMEYDFIVHPGGNPAQIKLKINDADKVTLTDKGELVVKTRLGEVREKTPVSYNEAGKAIATHFVMDKDGSLGFAGAFPKNKTLRIDPEVVWATYYGGSDLEYGNNCAADAAGNAYLIGETSSTSGIASGGFQNTYGGSAIDAFLVKFSASGARLWATYYGGASYDSAQSCKIDANGAIYLAGYTNSVSAIASGGAQNALAGSYDAFLVKFTSSGTRSWGTYFGATGRDHGYTCALDASGNVYLSGFSESATGIASGGFQSTFGGGTQDAFLAKFSSTGSRLWSTYYGGTGVDYAEDTTADSAGNIYLAGYTTSTSGIASGGFQNSHSGGTRDAYLAKFDASGSRLWATYYGGSDSDYGYSCATDSNGNVYLSGSTSSDGLASGGHQNTTGPNYKTDAILVKFNSSGNRLWATYYGQADESDGASSCMVDSSGNVYIAGGTSSDTGIASGGFQNTKPGGLDMYIAKFSASGSRLWGTYYGTAGYDSFSGAVLNNTGNIFVAGNADSNTGIATGGFQNTYGGGFMDAFLSKIYDQPACSTPAPVASAQTLVTGSTVASLIATGSNLKWYTTNTGGTELPSDTLVTAGTYYVSQTVAGCESTRTAVNLTLTTCGTPVELAVMVTSPTTANLSWLPNPFSRPTNYQYHVSTSATPPVSGTTLSTITINNFALTAGVTYYLHVRSNCNGTYSDWVTSAPFRGAVVADTCATALNLASLASPYYGTTVGATNDYSIACANGNTSPDQFFYIDVPNGATIVIGQTSNNYDSENYMGYGGSCPGTTRIACFDNEDIQNITWTNNTGSQQRVYWVQDGYSPASAAGRYTLEWSLTGATSPCGTPTALTGVTTSDTTANLSWTAPASSTPTGYQYVVSTSATPPTSGINVTGTSVIRYIISPGVKYYLHVRSNCNGVYGAWATSPQFFTPPPPGDTCETAINLATLTSPYNGTLTGAYNDSFPIDCTLEGQDLVYYIDVLHGQTLVIGLTARSGFDSHNYMAYGNSCPGTTIISCYDDPDIHNTTWTNSTGSTQRVYWIQEASFATSAGDFTLAWSVTGGCAPPTNPRTLSMTYTSANLYWTAPEVSTPTGYQYAVTTSSTPPASGTPTTATTINNYNGLVAFENYYLHVRTNCNGSYSSWVTSPVFMGATYGDFCSNAIDLSTLTSPHTNTTANTSANTPTVVCDGNVNNSKDLYYYINVPNGATLTIGQTSNDYDSQVSVQYTSDAMFCPGYNSIACFDNPDIQNITWTNTTGSTQIVYWVQGGRISTEMGNFTLAWTLTGGTTTCNPPASVTATPTSPTAVNLNWTAPTTGTPRGYQYAVTTSATPPASGTATTSRSVTGYTITAGTTYYLHVRSNCSGSYSSWTTSAPFTGTAPCPAPTSPSGVVASATTANLQWAVPTTGTPTGYQYAVTTSATPPASGIATTNTDIIGYAITANTDYYLHVRSNCNGTYSSWVTSPVFRSTAATCNPPTNLTATVTSATTVNLNWTASTSSAPVGYEFSITTSATPPASGTVYPNTSVIGYSVIAGTTYYLHVRTYCNGSYSDWSTSAPFVGSSAISGDTCANAINLAAITSPYSGTTTGAGNDYTFTCANGTTAPELFFYIDVPNGATLVIGQTVNGYDSQNYIGYGGSCPGATRINCFDDDDYISTTWTNTTGSAQRVYWVQDGYQSASGTFTLAWTLTVPCATPAPTASAQTFCNSATVANLVANGTSLKWYATATGGTQLATTAALATGTYYVSQTLNGCEGSRAAVNVTINTTTAPTATATQTLTEGSTVANLTATGTALQWYTAATGGTALPSTTALTSGTYYVSQTVNGCESTRSTVTVTITVGCINATYGLFPGTTFTPVCNGTAETITPSAYAGEYSLVNLTSGRGYILSSSVATDYITLADAAGRVYAYGTTPLTYNAVTSNLLRFYIHTNASCGESTVIRGKYVQCITPCVTPANITAQNITPNSADIVWPLTADNSGSYQVYVSTSATAPSNTAPGVQTPGLVYSIDSIRSSATNLSPGTQYYYWVRSLCSTSNSPWSPVGSFTTTVGCINAPYGQANSTAFTPSCLGSERAVGASPGQYALFNLTAGTSYTLTSSTATDYITITGDNGTTVLAYGTSPLAYTPSSTGVYRYYIHTNAACGIENVIYRDLYIDCNTSVCTAPTNLTVSAMPNGANILWNSPSANMSNYQVYISTSPVAPLDSVAAVAATGLTFYDMTRYNATGLNSNTTYYYWVRTLCLYTNSPWVSGGSFTTLPQLVCNNASFGLYPSTTFTPQCNGSSETIASNSWAGEFSNVNITANRQYTFTSGVATDYITITNAAGTEVLVSGTSGIVWNSGTYSGVIRYYMHLNSSCGEEMGAIRSKYISCSACTTPTPTASAQTFCNGATVANLVANGASLKWYATSTGGTQLVSTAALATGTYYVSQTINACESTRTAVAVTINTTTAPTASAQTFCNGATVANLVANGTSLKWYAANTGGTQFATTTTLATGTYYVSQTLNACESTRTAVAV